VRLGDRDQALRQFEWDAAVACGAMAALALALGRGRPAGAVSVLAGGGLMALSYWAIKGGVDVVVNLVGRHDRDKAPDASPEREGVPALPARRRVGLAVKFFTRYALLAVGAYVMLTCFRLHPVGLLAGAMTPFVAAAVLAVRSSRASSYREHP